MPHYRNGELAQVGDAVKGTTYNRKDKEGNPVEIVGRIISITPGSETCNCVVAFTDTIMLPGPPTGISWYEFFQKLGVSPTMRTRTDEDGTYHVMVIVPDTDYSETRAFDKIA